MRPLLLTKLLLRFIGHCILSGLTTALIILKRTPPPAGLVRFKYASMSITGASVLGALVTLTPGSSTIDIDPERQEMLLHLLDTRTAEASLKSIRRDFELDVAALFPEKRP
jgi:multicomponent K+:H+ antiporter subunit E/multicomponent Na+:H+ antiporter subunit E